MFKTIKIVVFIFFLIVSALNAQQDKKTTLNNIQIGDYVWCQYVASSGAFGTFSNI